MRFVKVFSAVCLASALGLLSLLALMLSRGNVPFSAMFPYVGLLGAIVGGLLYLGVDAFLTFGRVKVDREGEGLVLVRGRDGRVLSVKGEGRARVVRGLPAGGALKRGGFSDERVLRALKAAILAAVLFEAYLSSALLLGTFTPLMVVPSASMAPTLNVGDLILVRGVDAAAIRQGDIIVFNVPAPYDRYTPSPIVHRVVEVCVVNGEVCFRTKGDNNPSIDAWTVPAGNVIGKCVGRVPYVGLPILYLRTPYGLAALAAFIMLWIFYPRRRKVKGGRVNV